ncbi:MAG: trypsin-like peptidase domain-containing protein [Pseudomonadaceae bacterium]
MRELLRAMGWPVVCGVLLALLIIQQFPEWLGLPAHDIVLRNVSEPRSHMGLVSYSHGVERASPAVANIYTSKVADSSLRDYADSLTAPNTTQTSLGSAVILNPEGYLLTNNHVIAGADEILVALKDGREALATLIGTDPETDLAVLKIDLPNLPAITINTRDEQRIGDVVMAIGNPFGLGQTVTMGIISATGRNQLGLNTYEDFIQTDAAINQGNSGGALVDAEGNLIGINTAIFSQAGAAQGIGFAIPVRLAVEVMQAIIQHGHVIRGWLGVEVQRMTPELAESFGLDVSQGIVVASLYRNGPAWNAGLLPGDVILKIDGEPATSGRQAMNQVARAKPGDSIRLDVLRNGEPASFSAEVGVRPTFQP